MKNIHDYSSIAEEINELGLMIALRFLEKKYLWVFEKGYNGLLSVAQQHAYSRQRPISRTQQTVWVIHPSSEQVDNGNKPRKIQRLLDELVSFGSDTQRVLVDDAIDYVVRNHVYLENGLFDRVIFTPYNDGKPIRKTELRQFRHSERNLVGGCYVGMCLDTFVNVLQKQIPNGDIRVISRWSYKPPITRKTARV